MRISKNTYDAVKGDYLNVPTSQAPNRYLKYPSSVNGTKYYAENDAKNDGSIFYPGAGENVDSNDDHSGSTIFEAIPNSGDDIPKTYREIDKSTGEAATDATNSDSIGYLNGTIDSKDNKTTSFLGKRDNNIPKQSISTALSNSANGKYVFTRSLINNGDDPEINLGGDTSISDINAAVNTTLSNSARGSITGKSSTKTTDSNAISAFGTDLTNIYTTTDSLGNSSNYSKITSSVGSQDTNSEDVSLSDTLKDTALDALSAQTGISGKTVSSVTSLVNSLMGSSDVNISNLGASLAYLDSWKSSNYKSLHTLDWMETPYLNPSANVANTMSNDLRGTLGNSSAIDTTSVKSTLSTIASSLLGKSTTNTIASLAGVDSDWDATSSELTNLNSTTKDTIYTTKPGMTIKSKASVIEDITGNSSQYFVTSGKERNIDTAISSIRSKEVENSLSSTGRNFMKETSSDVSIKKKLDTYTANYYNTKSGKYINKKDESDFYGFNLSDRELRMIALLKQRNTYNKKLGYIYIRPTGASYNSFTENTDSSANTMQIPFEFNPTISEGAVTANYASETLLGRLGKFNIYTGTDLSSLTIETTYIALTPDTIDTDLEANSNKQYSTDAWQYYWTNNRIEQLELMFRSLVFPDVTNSDYLIKPPLIELHLCNNDGMDADTVGDLYKYPYVNGYVDKKAVNAIGGSTGTYLNVSVTLSGSEAVGRYKKYIVNSCQISPVSEDYINYPSLYGRKYNSSNASSMGQNAAWHVATGTNTTTTTNEDGTTTSSSSTCGYAGYSRKLGFKVTLSCTEVTENYIDLVPDFQAYYNAWSDKKALADDASAYADSYFGTSSNGTSSYQSAEDIITGSIATVASSLANSEDKLNELFGEAETLSKLYAKSLSKSDSKGYESDFTYEIGKFNYDYNDYGALGSKSTLNTYYWANLKFSESENYIDISSSKYLTSLKYKDSYKTTLNNMKSDFITYLPVKITSSKDFTTIGNSKVDNLKFYADNSRQQTKELTLLSKNDSLCIIDDSKTFSFSQLPIYKSSGKTKIVDAEVSSSSKSYVSAFNLLNKLMEGYDTMNDIIDSYPKSSSADGSTIINTIKDDKTLSINNKHAYDYFSGICNDASAIIGKDVLGGNTIADMCGIVQYNLGIYKAWIDTYYSGNSYAKILTYDGNYSSDEVKILYSSDYVLNDDSFNLSNDIDALMSAISESSSDVADKLSTLKSDVNTVNKNISHANSIRKDAKNKKIQFGRKFAGGTLTLKLLIECASDCVSISNKIAEGNYGYENAKCTNYIALQKVYNLLNSQDSAMKMALSKNRQALLNENDNIYGVEACGTQLSSLSTVYFDYSLLSDPCSIIQDDRSAMSSNIENILSSSNIYETYYPVTNLSSCMATGSVQVKTSDGNTALIYKEFATSYKIIGFTKIYNAMIDSYNLAVSKCKILANESNCSLSAVNGADETSETTSANLFGTIKENEYADISDKFKSALTSILSLKKTADSCVESIRENFERTNIESNFEYMAKKNNDKPLSSGIQTLSTNLSSFTSYGIKNYKGLTKNLSGETYYCYKSEDTSGELDYSLKVNAFGDWANKPSTELKDFSDINVAGTIPKAYYDYLSSSELKDKLSVASSTEAISNYGKLTT